MDYSFKSLKVYQLSYESAMEILEDRQDQSVQILQKLTEKEDILKILQVK